MVPNASSIEQAVVEDSAAMTVPLKRLPVGPKDLTASIELEIPWTFQIEAILKVKDEWQIHLSRGSESCLFMIRYYVRRRHSIVSLHTISCLSFSLQSSFHCFMLTFV